MDYNYNYSNAYSDSYFTPTSFDSEITNPVFHNFNQVCRIGLIRINICPNLSIMNKIRIITLFIESVGIQLPRVLLSTTLPINNVIYSIPRPTYIRRIFFRKQFWSLPWVQRQEQIIADSILPNDSQIQDPYSNFQV